jgi:hypothetical protein
VVFKIITKILTIKIYQVIHKYLEFSQTDFIPGRNIHDGVEVLHEVLHELKRTMVLALSLSWILRKLM